MRKEVAFAIVFGIVIGLVFAFGLFRVNGVMKNKSAEVATDNNTDVLKDLPETQTEKNALTLLKPTNKQVFGNDIVQISGMTRTESIIVTTGGTNDLITKGNTNGSFDFDYEIDPSLNYLDITSVSPGNERSYTKLEVVYSSEAVQKESEKEEAGEEDDIKDKLEKAQNRSEFYKGTITDLTNGNLQMKNGDGEIKQVSYSTNTSYAKIGKTTTKITSSDIAIGDYILALGYKKDNGVLEAFRILVTQPTTPEEVKIFYGTITKKNKSDIDISEQNAGSLNIEIDNNSKTYSGELSNPTKIRFANIKEGDLVIGTYITDKDANVARRIYILKTLEITPTPKK